ncbi:diguanylate cyclase [Geothrix campi]|uniref:diguanylate cyclase n=1 Tax=Geothrix campi TaxID=2966450 RepID=UPI00214957F7|nr:diguanylate cyclase [Geothrix sp. SG10]
MTQAASTQLMLLAALVFGLLSGVALGLWGGRRRSTADQADPDCRRQLEVLTRAQTATERANSELRQALDQMEQAAGTDRLTGAWNRRWFEDGAAQLVAQSGRGDGALSLLMVDLDRFKRVNDTFGHSVGDEVLKSVTTTIRGQLRASDALVRWGGEEFIVLCPSTTLAGATILAEKIRKAVEARSIPQVGLVTISLGVAQHQRAEGLHAWVGRADEALYRAKERGRNRTEASLTIGESHGDGESSILALTWDPDLECGHPEIDHQHQQLYHLSNSLLSAITSGRYPEEAKLRMQLLIAHVAQHFHDEEAILARMGHAGLAAHAREHGRLIAKAKALQQEMGGVSTDLPAILGFLALDLVKGHIMVWDRKFFAELAQD